MERNKKKTEGMTLTEIGAGLLHWFKPFVDTESLKQALRQEGVELAHKLSESTQEASGESTGETLPTESSKCPKSVSGLPEPCDTSLLKIRKWNEAKVLAKVRKKVMRYGLPAPEFKHTENELDITVRNQDKKKAIIFVGKAEDEQWMLDHIDEKAISLRPNHCLKLNDMERRAIIRNLRYISDEIQRESPTVPAFRFSIDESFASVHWGNQKHEVYLHSTQRNLDYIVDSFLNRG